MKTRTSPREPLLALLPLLGLALALALAGCGGDESSPAGASSTGTDDYETMDLDQAYGGLTATDEPEAFGDAYLMQLAAAETDEASDDPLLADPEVLALEALSEEPLEPGDPARPRFSFLRITWGMLDGAVDSLGNVDESLDLLDWSGMLRVDRGLVVVRRIILFERPYDHLIRPRLDRRTVAWVSRTGRHYDGLLVEIIERPGDLVDEEGDELAPNMLHFTTGPLSADIAVADLPGLDRIAEVDEQGNAIQFTGFSLADIVGCPKGFLSGVWRSLPATDAVAAGEDSTGAVTVGGFRGRWVGVLGHVHGFVRGRYGYDGDGEPVFYGKYIDRRGRFMGFLRGTWEPRPEAPGHGVFRGEWVNAAETVEGVLGGEWFHLPERPGGFFGGRWAVLCDQEAVDAVR